MSSQSDLLEFSCPHCQAIVQASPELAGQRIQCGQCEKRLKVPRRAGMQGRSQGSSGRPYERGEPKAAPRENIASPPLQNDLSATHQGESKQPRAAPSKSPVPEAPSNESDPFGIVPTQLGDLPEQIEVESSPVHPNVESEPASSQTASPAKKVAASQSSSDALLETPAKSPAIRPETSTPPESTAAIVEELSDDLSAVGPALGDSENEFGLADLKAPVNLFDGDAQQSTHSALAKAAGTDSSNQPPQSVEDDLADLDSTFALRCPICDSVLYVKLGQVGAKVKCDDCFSMITVTHPGSDKNAKLAAGGSQATPTSDDDDYQLSIDDGTDPVAETISAALTGNLPAVPNVTEPTRASSDSFGELSLEPLSDEPVSQSTTPSSTQSTSGISPVAENDSEAHDDEDEVLVLQDEAETPEATPSREVPAPAVSARTDPPEVDEEEPPLGSLLPEDNEPQAKPDGVGAAGTSNAVAERDSNPGSQQAAAMPDLLAPMAATPTPSIQQTTSKANAWGQGPVATQSRLDDLTGEPKPHPDTVEIEEPKKVRLTISVDGLATYGFGYLAKPSILMSLIIFSVGCFVAFSMMTAFRHYASLSNETDGTAQAGARLMALGIGLVSGIVIVAGMYSFSTLATRLLQATSSDDEEPDLFSDLGPAETLWDFLTFAFPASLAMIPGVMLGTTLVAVVGHPSMWCIAFLPFFLLFPIPAMSALAHANPFKVIHPDVFESLKRFPKSWGPFAGVILISTGVFVIGFALQGLGSFILNFFLALVLVPIMWFYLISLGFTFQVTGNQMEESRRKEQSATEPSSGFNEQSAGS